MFDLNVQTLYYYEQIGLLLPKRRNPQNGRRMYAFDQVYQLASIRYMRRLGYGIEEIKEFFQTSDIGKTLNNLRRHSAKMHRQWRELMLTNAIVERKLLYTEEKLRTIDVHSETVQFFPARRYLLIGGEESLYNHDSFYFYPTLVFYRDNTKVFGAYLDAAITESVADQTEDDLPEPDVIPAGEFLCAYHVGPYSSIPETEKRVRGAHPDLPLCDWFIDFNVIDQFIESNPEHYITEMQIPLRETIRTDQELTDRKGKRNSYPPDPE